ncbi:MAG TPA: sigma-70 family RNA polymerase sigma factor [Candidatus Angelobacter sp.]|nr:sigma-70 family RNA polymerase sigma factor [Candidatus Angelobacter sp.]
MTEAYVNAFVARTATNQQDTSFGQLMRENQRRVFQIAYSVLGNSADAEEVAQEAFLHAYQKFQSLRDPQKFRVWVNRISFRMALNRQRGSKRRMVRDTAWHDSAPEMLDGTKNAEDHMLAERLRRQIEQLPEKFRRVLQLSIVEEMDATDAAAVLGIPPGTVRSRLHTARKLLLEAMQ